MKSRYHSEYIAAYKRTISSKLGRKLIFQRLDNETSAALESFARSNGISIQYCAPHQHRALKVERAIRTFKNHFIATLCTVADDFPLELWDELLPQAELCLNHLLPYPSNTNISAYTGLHGGAFDFAAHLIAPAGTKVVIHDKPTISYKSIMGATWYAWILFGSDTLSLSMLSCMDYEHAYHSHFRHTSMISKRVATPWTISSRLVLYSRS